jgi:hypothetical protein
MTAMFTGECVCMRVHARTRSLSLSLICDSNE